MMDLKQKAAAMKMAAQMRKEVQYVRVKKIGNGRLKWGVFLGGRNSGMFV